jgi:hypothetical protein
MKQLIRPGKVVPSRGTGNPWQFTIVHPTRGERRHAETFTTAFFAKQRMREFVENYNTAVIKEDD